MLPISDTRYFSAPQTEDPENQCFKTENDRRIPLRLLLKSGHFGIPESIAQIEVRIEGNEIF